MVKTNIIGSSSGRRHWRTIAEDCVRQLADTTVCDWISNGENAVHGRLWTIKRCPKGLRINLDNGQHVTWKIGERAVDLIIHTLGQRIGWGRLHSVDRDDVGAMPIEMTLN